MSSTDTVPCERFLGLERADSLYRIGDAAFQDPNTEEMAYVSDVWWNDLAREWRYDVSFEDGLLYMEDISTDVFPPKTVFGKFRAYLERL